MLKKFLFASVISTLSASVFAQKIVQTGSLPNDVENARSFLLANGNVILFGGDNGNGQSPVEYRQAYIYNVSNGTWSSTGSMHSIRSFFDAAQLGNGNILAVAGDSSGAQCEIYNVSTGKWSYTGSLHTYREQHAVATMKNGKVLTAGGSGDSTAEVYDPATGKWTLTGRMNNLHGSGITLTSLADGTVLAVGGQFADTTAEIYDPTTDKWTLVGNTAGKRMYHSAILLSNGKVLVVGGTDFNDNVTSELYDPSTKKFTKTGDLGSVAASVVLINLPNNKVFTVVFGDFFSTNTKVFETYDVASGTWSYPTTTGLTTEGYCMNMLKNGNILFSAGTYTPLNGASNACGLIEDVISDLATTTDSKVSLNVYPNPAKDILNINLQAEGQSFYTISLKNIMGQEVRNLTLQPGMNILSLDDMARGVYVYTIEGNNTVLKTSQLVLQ